MHRPTSRWRECSYTRTTRNCRTRFTNHSYNLTTILRQSGKTLQKVFKIKNEIKTDKTTLRTYMYSNADIGSGVATLFFKNFNPNVLFCCFSRFIFSLYNFLFSTPKSSVLFCCHRDYWHTLLDILSLRAVFTIVSQDSKTRKKENKTFSICFQSLPILPISGVFFVLTFESF